MKRRLKTQSEERPLPHDKDAEVAILGAIVAEATNYRKAARLVSAGDFFFEEHRIAFQGLSRLAEESKPTDDASLIACLGDGGLLEKAGGTAYVAQLADGVHTKFDVTIPARRVHELSVLRQIATRSNLTTEAALKPGARARDVITSGAAGLRDLLPHVSVNGFAPSGNGAEILEAVERFIRRFVSLTADEVAILALWVAHTHAFACATSTPYLSISSAEKRSGKTRLLEVLELLAANPWFTSRTSAAALVRKIEDESPTLLLDESDAAFGGEKEYAEALRAILDSGHRIGGTASLCVGQWKEISVRDFNTFGPKAIAGLGKLPDTVADRSIPIVLRRAAGGEIPERFRRRKVEPEASELRDRLAQWTASIFETLDNAEPYLPEAMNDRQQDGAEPLLAIADAAGGEWPDKSRSALTKIFRATQDDSIRVRLLADIRTVMDGNEETPSRDRIGSTELADALGKIETSPWGEWLKGKPLTVGRLARLLSHFGITPTTKRIAGSPNHRGYERADFEDSWLRYLPHPGLQSATVPQANTGAGSSNFSKCHADFGVAVQKREIVNTGAACGVVALSKRPQEERGRDFGR